MKNRRGCQFDILCAGELLIDFISSGFAESLNEANTFERRMANAFWSGFLTAWLDGYSPINCAKAGRGGMAELK